MMISMGSGNSVTMLLLANGEKAIIKSKMMNSSYQSFVLSEESYVRSGGIPAEELMGDIDETRFEEIIMETPKDNASTSMFYSPQNGAVYAEQLMDDLDGPTSVENLVSVGGDIVSSGKSRKKPVVMAEVLIADVAERFSSENRCEGPIPAEDLMADAEDNLSFGNRYQGSIRAEDLMGDVEDGFSSGNSCGGPIPVEELMGNVGETFFRRNDCEKMNGGRTRSSGGAVYAEELMDDLNSIDSVVDDDLFCSKSAENSANSKDQLFAGEYISSNFKRINRGTTLEHFKERLGRVLYRVIEIEPNASFGRLMTQSTLFYNRLWMFNKEESFFKLPKMDKVWRLLEYSKLRNNEDMHMIMTNFNARFQYLAALEFAANADANSGVDMLFCGQQTVNALNERTFRRTYLSKCHSSNSTPTHENQWNTTMGAPGSAPFVQTNGIFSSVDIPYLENRSALEYSAIQSMPAFSRSLNEITCYKMGKKDDTVQRRKRIFAKISTKDDRAAEKVQRSEKKLKKDKEHSAKRGRNI